MEGEPFVTPRRRRPSTPREKQIRKAILSRLAALPKTWRVGIAAGPFQVSGLPDIIACVNGILLAIEVKRPGERPTAKQEITLRRLSEAGAVAGLAFCVADAEALWAKAAGMSGLLYQIEAGSL